MAKCTEGCGRVAGVNGLCEPCEDYGMWENSHEDEGHDNYGPDSPAGPEQDFMKDCPVCHPELDPRNIKTKVNKPVVGKATYTRRPQLDHTKHHHPQTPAARRACKNAFWAVRKEQDITPVNVEAKHFAAWDFNCDGRGKQIPIETVKPGSGWNVAPLGPKGGVGASVKAAAAKAAKK